MNWWNPQLGESTQTPALVKLRRRGQAKTQEVKPGEDGYILLAVLFLMVMVLITLSIAAPKVAADIERDREIELMHRGLQYKRAIKMYYKKFAAYPPNMDALEKSNEIRFLRKRYKDPMTGKDEWHLIHMGENKTPTAMGFFGQPLSGIPTSSGGVGSGGGIGQSIGTSIGSTGTDTSSGSSTSSLSSSGSTSGLGSSTSGSNSPFGSNTASVFGASSNSVSSQTVGGMGIIGVESTSPKLAILEYKKKKHFNEWEFVYDPQEDRLTISNNTGAVGQPASGSSAGSIFGSPSLTNQAPNTTPTTTTTTPQ